jgi:2',3'-cyclic-nucleotide 2'-phosphodiesterase (5'-nucleotidase family)
MFRLKFFFFGVAVAASLSLVGCARRFSVADSTYTQYQVTKDSVADPTAEQIIRPYRDSLSGKMNVVIGTSAKQLSKGQPESELGNFCADAFLKIARDAIHQGVDVCIINNGGLRLPSLPQGDITVGKIFELLPFDNMIVVTTVTGDSLQAACDLIAKAGGWPVSGLTFRIENSKAVDVMVNNESLQRDKVYKVVTSDYVANGGDNMFMLKHDSQLNTGLLMRDAMIDYIKALDKPISADLQNRIAVK